MQEVYPECSLQTVQFSTFVKEQQHYFGELIQKALNSLLANHSYTNWLDLIMNILDHGTVIESNDNVLVLFGCENYDPGWYCHISGGLLLYGPCFRALDRVDELEDDYDSFDER